MKYLVEIELAKVNSDAVLPTPEELKHFIGCKIISLELSGHSILKLTMIDPPEDPNRCPKGGLHEWGTDGQHSNEFCKKCYRSSPAEMARRQGIKK